MYAVLLFLHLVICLALIGVVLIQSGKGGGLAGGAFGGSAQTVFGGRGATDIVTRSTMVLGGLFFVTSLVLALMTTGQRAPRPSLVQTEAQKAAGASQQPGGPGGSPSAPGGGQPSAVPQPPGGAAPGGSQPSGAGGTPTPTQPPAGGGR